MKKLKVLAIEPYYDGSHKAFMDAFIRHSVHEITLLSMPARKWKWRMRGAAVEMAAQLADMGAEAGRFDALFTCDMLNLAEFKGLSGWDKPAVVYFHENQFTYPNQLPDERDFQFGITNLTTVLASDAALFNSRFHLEDFYGEARKVLRKMPDFKCLEQIEKAKAKSSVVYPGIEGCFNARIPANETPVICWAARWEHDKNPADFFEAVELLLRRGLKFKISVLGQGFANSPAVFAEAKEKYAGIIECWGYQESRKAYLEALEQSDIFVSTAIHEFFGISALEAAACGCAVLLPQRLAYPETFPCGSFHYAGDAKTLACRLEELLRNRDMLKANAEAACSIPASFRTEDSIRIIDERLPEA